MISFNKIFVACLCINIAIAIVNFSGVFPEHWNSNYGFIEQTYKTMKEKLKSVENIDNNLLKTLTYAYILFLGIQLAIEILLLGPAYVASTINMITSSVGMPSQLGVIFPAIYYFSFILFVIDVIRGRSIS